MSKTRDEYIQVIKLCDDLIRDYYKHNCSSSVDIERIKQLRLEAERGLHGN